MISEQTTNSDTHILEHTLLPLGQKRMHHHHHQQLSALEGAHKAHTSAKPVQTNSCISVRAWSHCQQKDTNIAQTSHWFWL